MILILWSLFPFSFAAGAREQLYYLMINDRELSGFPCKAITIATFHFSTGCSKQSAQMPTWFAKVLLNLAEKFLTPFMLFLLFISPPAAWNNLWKCQLALQRSCSTWGLWQWKFVDVISVGGWVTALQTLPPHHLWCSYVQPQCFQDVGCGI